ncbi:hypothetical protein M075_3585 [Bacteroides fragilis str. 20793-3]|nr:hypothetical protein M075_3585 [Bacteroides fragilis str. 20793-3]
MPLSRIWTKINFSLSFNDVLINNSDYLFTLNFNSIVYSY